MLASIMPRYTVRIVGTYTRQYYMNGQTRGCRTRNGWITVVPQYGASACRGLARLDWSVDAIIRVRTTIAIAEEICQPLGFGNSDGKRKTRKGLEVEGPPARWRCRRDRYGTEPSSSCSC